MTSPIIMPGIHHGLSREEYDAIDAVNQSALKVLIERTPAHFKYARENPEPPTDALRFGQILHLACFEPSRFAAEVVERPKIDRRTNAGKAEAAAWEAANEGRLWLEADEYALLTAMQRAVMDHPDAATLIGKPGMREPTVVWRDEETGVQCKARLDLLIADNRGIVDVKSVRDARDHMLTAANRTYGYDVQAAFYVDGVMAAGGCPEMPFVLIYIDKEWAPKIGPDAVVCRQMDQAALALGRKLYREALATYAECVKSGRWSGFTRGITDISVPTWALNRHEIEWSESLQETPA